MKARPLTYLNVRSARAKGKGMKRAAAEGRYFIIRLQRDVPGLMTIIGDAVDGLPQAKEMVARLNRAAAPHEHYGWRKVRPPRLPPAIKIKRNG